MTDEEFLDVLNFDNCGREDVHPLHEAAGWNAWMEKTGKSVIDIAARIGQSKEYVYQRLKYSALAEPVRKAFIDGDVSAGHAILIARQQPAEQMKSLEYCLPKNGYRQRPSVRDLQSHIKFSLNLDLEEAPFDLADAALVPAAGACAACLKQTKNAPPPQIPELADPVHAIAGEEQDDEDFMSDEELYDEEFPKGQCMDPGCFKLKVDARLVQIKAKLESAGTAILEISGNRKTGKKGPLGTDRYEVVADGVKSAKAALLVDGPDVGKVVHVRIKPEVSTSAPARPSWQIDREKQERERKEKEEKAKGEAAVRLRILEAVRAKISAGMSRSDIQPLVEFAAARLRDAAAAVICELHGIKPTDDALVKAVPKMGELEFVRLVMELPIAGELDPWEIAWQRCSDEGILALAKRHKVDAVKIRADIEEKRKVAEGGTRREVEKPAQSKTKTAAKKKVAAKAAAKPKPRGAAKKVPAKKAK
jgi:hypothetical protein